MEYEFEWEVIIWQNGKIYTQVKWSIKDNIELSLVKEKNWMLLSESEMTSNFKFIYFLCFVLNHGKSFSLFQIR